MKQAIIFGATGFIGKAIIKALQTHNIAILAIGRKSFEHSNLMLEAENYLQFQSDQGFETLFDLIHEKISDETVFYNVAWSGENRLTDGNLEEQIKNIFLSSKALEFTKQLGCSKFINISSQEDAIFNHFIQTSKWKKTPYTSSPLFYAASKHFSKDITTLLAYLNKIDYINTRFSIAITPRLDGISFVASTLKKIKNRSEYSQPQNPNLCEIIELDELAEAYYQIGMHGRNKADYYLGLGQTNTLRQYFEYFDAYLKDPLASYSYTNEQDIAELFDPSTLHQDTGFRFTKDFPTLAKEIANS